MDPRTRAKVRQQAIRQMCFDSNGNLTKNARFIAAHLQRFCAAVVSDDGASVFPRVPQTGAIDPLAMARAAGRREVFDHLARMLSVNLKDRHNLQDDQ